MEKSSRRRAPAHYRHPLRHERRKAAEEQILANEAFLENLLGSIEEGISVLAPDMTVRYANQTMTRWYAEKMPVVGKKCHQAFHRLGECCSRCPAVRSLRTGRNEFEVLEITSTSALRAIEFNSYPIKDAQSGAVTGVIVFVRDITSKRQIQQALAEIEDKYHSIYEGAPIGMCTVDAKGRFVSMNPSYARLYGYSSPQEMMGSVRSLAELFDSREDWTCLGEMIARRTKFSGSNAASVAPTARRAGLPAPSAWSATPVEGCSITMCLWRTLRPERLLNFLPESRHELRIHFFLAFGE
jgi:PAS domain S-box-containing protein